VFAVWVLHQSLYERIPGPRASHHCMRCPRRAATAGTDRLSSTRWLMGSDSVTVAAAEMAAMTGTTALMSGCTYPSHANSSMYAHAMPRLPAQGRRLVQRLWWGGDSLPKERT